MRKSRRRSLSAGWPHARTVLSDVLERWAGPSATVQVDWAGKVGDGLSREIFAADVDISFPDSNRRATYAAVLPRRDADPELGERTRHELRLLERLGEVGLRFRVPRVFGLSPVPGGLALVREFMRGIELDLRAGRQHGVLPWEIVADIAAALHSLDAAGFADVVPGHATRRDHALAQLTNFDDLSGADLVDARAWCLDHLPPDQPAVLVHGDLLGQNILLGIDEPPAVIDWEYVVRGDPAHDLAIVTRGGRRPFQIAGGLEKLLEAYRQRGGAPVTRAEVHVHELCLAAGWYRASLRGDDRNPEEEALATLSRILRRARTSGVIDRDRE